MEQKTGELLHKKGRKTASFFLHHSIFQAGITQCQTGTPKLEIVPFTGKGRAEWVTSFPSLLSSSHPTPRRTCFGISPCRDRQSWDLQRWLGTGNKNSNYQCQSLIGIDLGSQGSVLQSILGGFTTEESSDYHSCHSPPADFTRFHPIGIPIPRCQMPEFLLAS